MTVKLLIADDHAYVLVGLKLLHASEDFDVIEATARQQAVRMAERIGQGRTAESHSPGPQRRQHFDE